jgi:hypothetical protein
MQDYHYQKSKLFVVFGRDKMGVLNAYQASSGANQWRRVFSATFRGRMKFQ